VLIAFDNPATFGESSLNRSKPLISAVKIYSFAAFISVAWGFGCGYKAVKHTIPHRVVPASYFEGQLITRAFITQQTRRII
jgi:hypothetical protein